MGKYHQLNRNQRYQIERWLGNGLAPLQIAKALGVHRSTIYRELSRNRTKAGIYTGLEGWRKTKDRRNRYPSGYKIKGWVEERILDGLSKAWSPEMISGRLKLDTGFSISHEAIYKYILKNRKYGGKLHTYLRRSGRKRQKRFGRKSRFLKIWEPRKSIEQRPHSANSRSEFGHWERDLMLSSHRKGGLLVLADRKSRFVLLKKVRSTKSNEILQATLHLSRAHASLPTKTFTNDNGVEFAKHKELQQLLGTPVYFARPYAAWQRGTIENRIGLIRKFIPKGFDVHQCTTKDIQLLQNLINLLPLKIHGYRTPKEILLDKNLKLCSKKCHDKYLMGVSRNLFGQILSLSH